MGQLEGENEAIDSSTTTNTNNSTDYRLDIDVDAELLVNYNNCSIIIDQIQVLM